MCIDARDGVPILGDSNQLMSFFFNLSTNHLSSNKLRMMLDALRENVLNVITHNLGQHDYTRSKHKQQVQ